MGIHCSNLVHPFARDRIVRPQTTPFHTTDPQVYALKRQAYQTFFDTLEELDVILSGLDCRTRNCGKHPLVPTFVHAATNLKNLDLNLDHRFAASRVPSLLQPQLWPALEHLYLANLHIWPDDLLNFLGAHKNTLRILDMLRVKFRASGSWDYEEEYNGLDAWTSLFGRPLTELRLYQIELIDIWPTTQEMLDAVNNEFGPRIARTENRGAGTIWELVRASHAPQP